MADLLPISERLYDLSILLVFRFDDTYEHDVLLNHHIPVEEARYEKIFEDACDRIVREREWVFRELSKLGWLEPYESQANYIMCRITEGMTATALAQKLVNDYGLYIKDLTGKLGFNDERHFRIAVRDRADNETLIRALRQIG
jgi:histidinol-phosphate/aromatic aminotransferase/cobyric acid decarboxylase-like protein